MYITPYYRNSFSPFIKQLDRIFENAFEFDAQPAYATANVYELDDRYVVSMDAPGFAKDAFDIEIERGQVRVQAESRSEDNDPGAARSVSRAFRLPETVDASAVSAKYEDGVLSLDLPKQAKATAQKIAIN
ncbi:MAG: Hsp20/alpha crystallin family protein [Opitutales bacterium]